MFAEVPLPVPIVEQTLGELAFQVQCLLAQKRKAHLVDFGTLSRTIVAIMEVSSVLIPSMVS